MRRLAGYVRPYWLQATVSSVAVTLKSVCDVIGPILVMMAIDRYLAPNVKGEDATSALAHWLDTSSPLARVLPTDAYRGITMLAGLYLAALLAVLHVGVCADLPDAVDGAEGDVRSAPRTSSATCSGCISGSSIRTRWGGW